jgi:hypothetical protein
MIVVAYENRPEMLVGMKLLALSLARHCPDVSVRIVLDCPTDEFAQWSQRLPNLSVTRAPRDIGRGYDVKPSLLLSVLEGGANQAVWIDSDIVLSGDFRKRLAGSGTGTAVQPWARYHAPYKRMGPRNRPGAAPHGQFLFRARNTSSHSAPQTMAADADFAHLSRRPIEKRSRASASLER